MHRTRAQATLAWWMPAHSGMSVQLGTVSNSLILSNHLICLPWLLQVGKLVKHVKHITHESHDNSREGFLLRIKQKYKGLFLPSLLHINLTELFTEANGPDANLAHRNPSYSLC